MPHAYPIFLDVTNRLIVIVGGGAVASRKASGLLSAGAKHLRAVSPKFVREFPAAAERIEQSFAPAHLDGAEMVFAATDSPQANEFVVAEARCRHIWVNRADVDDDDPADFTTPALLRVGAITVAVSASGAPALAAALRDALAGTVNDSWANLADATKQLRPVVKAMGLSIARRREIFRALATPDAADALGAGDIEHLWAWLRERFTELPPKRP
jgi:siroheme synthase-like protein